MAKVFRLFDVKDSTEQVLLNNTGYNEEKDCYELQLSTHLSTDHFNATLTITMGFDDEEKSLLAFDDYNQNKAETFRYEMDKNYLNELS